MIALSISRFASFSLFLIFFNVFASLPANAATVSNPIIWADVPDVSVVRVDSTYYMVSTTMHLNPGAPIMESTDLSRWRIINYAHQALAQSDELNLLNGKSAYGKGSWASSIRYKNGTYYVLTPSYTTGKTHLYKTTDIHNGPWTESTLPFYHDPSLLLDDDGRVYVVYGSTDIRIVELTEDGTAVKTNGVNKVLIPGASSIAGSNFYVKAEGSHIEKINGKYYVFLITWPSTSCRTELVYRSSTLTGTYEGKIALQNNGVAQGSIFDTPEGNWYAMLFRDAGSVGRIPYLVPVTWSNDWPVFGTNSQVPSTLELPNAQEAGYGMVTSDDFSKTTLPLEWQWNHNPDAAHWSLAANPGNLRITTSRVDASILTARNTLTQRSFGPTCSGRIALDASGMKDGDVAGLAALQDSLGFVAVKKSGTSLSIVQYQGKTQKASTSISQNRVYLRIDMNFANQTDKATFYYSLDSTNWTSIGNTLSMTYTLGMFIGYRFALFNYATTSSGGYADFDWYKIGTTVSNEINLTSTTTPKEQTPYGDTLQIPGTIQSEDYDNGGQNVSYYDTDAGNSGGVYRNDDADVDSSAGDYFYGWVANGEWIEWTVNVTTAGSMKYTARLASQSDAASFSLYMDDDPIAQNVAVPNTGSWTTFQEITGTTSALTKGTHVLKLTVDAAYFNIDWIRFDDPTIKLQSTPKKAKVQSSTPVHYFDLLGRKKGTK